MNEELEHAKTLYSDLIPYDDPEYEQKVEAYAKAFLELDITELPLTDERNITDDLPW